MKRLSSVLLLSLPFLSGPLGAAGVPLLYRSAATDDGASPAAVVAHGGADAALAARLVDTADGVAVVSFEREGKDPARYAYLGFSFTASEPYAVVVKGDGVPSVSVTVNGRELATVGGVNGAFAEVNPTSGSQSVVIRLDGGGAVRRASVGVSVRSFTSCPTLQPVLCGEVGAGSPRGLTYDLGLRPAADASRADLLIPAIVRADGLHGPVRSDVTLLNRFDAPLRVRLTLRSPGAGASPERVVDLAAHSRLTLTDVVRHLLPEAAEGQGVLEVRGFTSASPGDVTAETYYDGGESGRIGSSLPVFSGDAPRGGAAATVLSATSDEDPRLLLFSSDPTAREVTGTLLVVAGSDRVEEMPLGVTPDRPISARLSDLFGDLPAGALVTVLTNDPALHAVLVRSDPVTGSPRLVSSN
jgi:hypothetical protein